MSSDEIKPTNNRAAVFNAAAIVAAAFVISRVLGFGREIVFNYYYPIDGNAATAYATVSWLPELVFNIVAGGALGSAFIPTFSTYFVRRDLKGAWRLFSSILNLVIIAAIVLSVALMVVAPWIIDTFYAASVAGSPELRQTMIDLLRILLITPVLFGAGGVMTATLHTRQQFLWPSIAPIVYNLGLIVGIIVFQPDVLGVGYGAVVGALGYLLVQIPGLRPLGAHYRPIFRSGDGGVRQVLVLMLPRMLGLSFSFLNLAIIPYVAQTMEDGSVRALQLAYRLMLLPSAVFGQALGIASFPTFSTLAAQNQLAEMRRILADTLRLIVFLGLPITVGMIIVREPLIAVLFQRRAFTAQATAYTAWALLFFALALVALAGIEVIARAFYAMKDTWTPVILGVLQLILMYILSIWLGQTFFPALGWLSFGGVALGFSIANWLELVALLLLLRRKMHGIGGRRLWSGVWRMGVAVAVMAVVMGIVHQQFLPGADGSFWQYLWAVLIPSAVGGLVYLVLCQLLKVDELQAIFGIVMRRIRR